MKTVLSLTAGLFLLPLAALAAPPAQAPSQAPAQAPPSKQVQAPAQAPTQAPAKTAQVDTGYRTYSYQPTMGYGYADPYNGYRGRGPAYRTGPASQGFYRADHKVTGPY